MGTVNIQQYREFLTDIYNVVYDFSEKFRIRLQYRRIRPPAQPGTLRFARLKENVDTLSEGVKRITITYIDQINIYDTYIDYQFQEFSRILQELGKLAISPEFTEQFEEDHLIISAKIAARKIKYEGLTDETFESGSDTAESTDEIDSIDEYLTRTIASNKDIWENNVKPAITQWKEFTDQTITEIQTIVLEIIVPTENNTVEQSREIWNEGKNRINNDRNLIA